MHDPNYADALRGDMNISGGVNGKTEHWVDYAYKSLVVLGIAALVAMTIGMRDTVTRLDTYISTKDKENEREFARIYKALDGHDQRLDRLERRQGSR